MKHFLIEICYDLYKQSLTDEKLSEQIQEVCSKEKKCPSIHDFEEIDYKTDNSVKILKSGEYIVWNCIQCGDAREHMMSEWDKTMCEPCWDYLQKEKDKNDEKKILE